MIALSGSSSLRGHEVAAGKLVEQPVGEIVEIVQAFAQIRVGLALQPGAGIALHPLNRRLRGQTCHDRFAQTP